jgi:hypothetical protein
MNPSLILFAEFCRATIFENPTVATVATAVVIRIMERVTESDGSDSRD